MLTAITRAVSRSIAQCELTHLQRIPIDLENARRQHHAYQDALCSLGVKVLPLPEQPDLPDAVFVEDVAILLDELAILTRPGADSRLPEVDSIARILASFRTLQRIQSPGTLDGGDVLVVDKTIWVGQSSRSNRSALDQLQAFLDPHGYQVRAVTVTGCLHLKSAVTRAALDTLLINPQWISRAEFPGLRLIEVDPSEPSAGNVLLVGDVVLCQLAFPRTNERLDSAGIRTLQVDASELAKAEGALTCCSLIFKENG